MRLVFATTSRISLRRSTRHFSTTWVRGNVGVRNGPESLHHDKREFDDVVEMDRLLRNTRENVDPAHHRSVPVRSKGFWAEGLLNSTRNGHETPMKRIQIPEARPMSASYSEIVLPFGSSPELLEQYINASGRIRMGMLMEHLDSLAGSIAYKHLLGPEVKTMGKITERGFYIVTASVDRLDMLADPNPNEDLRLSGQVIYTGTSSMEVAVRMESVGREKETTVLLGRFSMVCRDAETHTASPVPQLLRNSQEEHDLWSMGENIKTRRKAISQRSLLRVPPTSEEAAELHHVYLHKQLKLAEGTSTMVPMSQTKIESSRIMFPQERNIHGKVFGGYLMRLAYELGFASTVLFAGRPFVRFLSLDGISFAKPVPIGSILKLSSQVIHSTENLVHVAVKADVVNVATGHGQTTNDFRFTWSTTDGEPLNRIVAPETYQEAMLWIEGRRALAFGDEIRGYIKAKDDNI